MISYLKNKFWSFSMALMLLTVSAILTFGQRADGRKPAYLQGMQAVIAGGTAPESTNPC